LAWTLTKLGRLPEAAAHYRTLLIHEPTLVAARSNLAGVLIADGRPSEALDVLRQASDGSSPEEVIDFFSEALVARPGDASLRLGLLQGYLTSGRVDLAREQYAVLRRLHPSLSVSVGALLPIVASK
jgi:Flp pilus assembly protein TadD